MNANLDDEQVQLSAAPDAQHTQLWHAIEETHHAYLDLIGSYIKARLVSRYELEWQRFLGILHQLFQAVVKHTDLSEMPEVEKTMMTMKAEGEAAAALCHKPSVGGPSL